MKKTLFFLLITGIACSLQAQNSASVQTKCITVSPLKLTQMRSNAKQASEKSSATANQSKKTHSITSVEPHLPFMGSAANVNGTLDATTTAITANQACDLIVMTHRDDYSNVATCGTGAYIEAYSTDNGSQWDTASLLFCNSNATAGARYPNGVIFNPVGNTTPAHAYDAMAGPWTNGVATGDSWVETVHGSITIGGSNAEQASLTNPPLAGSGKYVQNNGDLSFMSSSDDSTVHVIGQGFNLDGAGNFTRWRGAVLTTGKFKGGSADSFTWTQTLFHPHIVPSYAGFNNSLPLYDSDAAPLSVPGTAWSQDGKTGYVVIFANADSAGYNFYTDQPIVYKTTNSGATWAMLPLFNFRNIPSLTTYLEPTTDSASVKIPIWYTFETGGTASQGAVDDYDLTVDYQGNLHIFGAVVSSFYCNPDSSYTVHFYANQDGYIYDVSTSTPTGGWKARFIDSMNTLPCANAGRSSVNTDWDSSSSAGFIGFGNRLQASRSTDGKHIFCTWEDDLSGLLTNQLVFPDVYGQGYDIPTNHAGSVLQFTKTANNYMLCVSDIVITSVIGPDTNYTVPCSIEFPQQLPDDGTSAVNYYYLDNIVYSNNLGLSVPTVTAKEQFSIGPNYPNPFKNTTQFNISLTNENVVSVDVFNLFGQKVYSMPSQQMSSGNHLMTINGSGWSAGVYFYRVTVGDQSKTQKMVVQ